MNLEAAGVDYDNTLQTSNRHIYAAGDACLEHKFTHTADASARIVVQNALFLGRQRLSALTIPWCTYTDPEIAHVGLYVRQARAQDDAPPQWVRDVAQEAVNSWNDAAGHKTARLTTQ